MQIDVYRVLLFAVVLAILGLQVYRWVMLRQEATPDKALASNEHGIEVGFLYVMGGGVLLLIWRAIEQDKLQGLDVAAFLLIIQRCLECISDRWKNRTIASMGSDLANAPPTQPPSTKEGQEPVPLTPAAAPAPASAPRGMFDD